MKKAFLLTCLLLSFSAAAHAYKPVAVNSVIASSEKIGKYALLEREIFSIIGMRPEDLGRRIT